VELILDTALPTILGIQTSNALTKTNAFCLTELHNANVSETVALKKQRTAHYNDAIILSMRWIMKQK